MTNRKQETTAVKNALKSAGIIARVGHGTGTARGWLRIKINAAEDRQQTLANRAVEIAQAVTGRRGPYDGCISAWYSAR